MLAVPTRRDDLHIDGRPDDPQLLHLMLELWRQGLRFDFQPLDLLFESRIMVNWRTLP